MRAKTAQAGECEHRRYSDRVQSLREITMNYEGRSEKITVRPPDLSAHGMFINTTHGFPEGSILTLQFRLAISGREVQARCEVRYCLPGVGVGVEFVEISREAAQIIEREVRLSKGKRRRK